MSGSDGQGGFIGRWSRLKQEAKKSATDERELTVDAEERASEPENAVEEVFDPTKLEIPLPSLDEIVPGMNMSPFFQKGVPEMLRNAALRKLWVTDPAIRDFENPAREYAYDWNVPGGVPGSGELVGDHDAVELLRDLMRTPETGPSDKDNASQAEATETGDHFAVAKETDEAEHAGRDGDPADEPVEPQPAQAVASDIATFQVEPPDFAPAQTVSAKRRHGGALPESGA